MKEMNNSLFVKMDMEELLRLMNLIAASLVRTRHVTDFTVHDTNFVRRTNAGTPFLWMVYNSGTHLCVLDDVQGILNFKKTLDYYEHYSKADFCLYRYDGEKLFPVFPKDMRKWINDRLSEYSL
jgi:hypothetical protein